MYIEGWIAANIPEDQAGSTMLFPAGKGTYILTLRLSTPAHLLIGRLGAFDFPAGWYAYVGSAFGPGGLRGRLKHHLAVIQKPHWHIDYLRQQAPVQEVWVLADEAVLEHIWAGMLRSSPGAVIPAQRFGASDCRCQTHLFHFPEMPDFEHFCDVADKTLQRWSVDKGAYHVMAGKITR